jgi:hypothetical protein
MNLDWDSTQDLVDFRVASTVSVDISLPSTYVKRTSTTAASRMGTDLDIMLINNVVPLYSGSYISPRVTYHDFGCMENMEMVEEVK